MKARRSTAPHESLPISPRRPRYHPTQKDVKNEDRSDYVYENKGDNDKLSCENTAFYWKMTQWSGNLQESARSLGRNCMNFAIIRGEIEPIFDPCLRGPQLHDSGRLCYDGKSAKFRRYTNCHGHPRLDKTL